MGMDPEQEALLWPHVALGAFTKGQSLTQVWVAQKWECYGAFLPLHEVSEVSTVPWTHGAGRKGGAGAVSGVRGSCSARCCFLVNILDEITARGTLQDYQVKEVKK